MARVHRLRAPSTAAGASRHSRVLEKKTKAPYKVVFEQVTEKKRKLVTVVSCWQYVGLYRLVVDTNTSLLAIPQSEGSSRVYIYSSWRPPNYKSLQRVGKRGWVTGLYCFGVYF